MARFHIVWLSIGLAALACCPPPHISAQKPELATQVCKNTTDFDFCRASVYSDPRAADADRTTLIDIIYRNAYSNATDTKDFIASHINSGGVELKKCLGNYNEVIQKLNGMMNDLNSETYYELDVRSLEVGSRVRHCQRDLHRNSVIWERNGNMIKLVNICYVVSKLFEYH